MAHRRLPSLLPDRQWIELMTCSTWKRWNSWCYGCLFFFFFKQVFSQSLKRMAAELWYFLTLLWALRVSCPCPLTPVWYAQKYFFYTVALLSIISVSSCSNCVIRTQWETLELHPISSRFPLFIDSGTWQRVRLEWVERKPQTLTLLTSC